MEKLFLAKIKDSNDRDCVYYLDLSSGKFECNHYFSGLHICGACFSGFQEELKNEVNNNYNNLDTILSKDDFNVLFQFDKNISDLGYSIVMGDERYQKGLEIVSSIQYIIDKLNSNENEQMFAKVINDEKDYCINEYDFSSEEIDEIFDNYCGDYKDRSIIVAVYSDKDDMVYEEKFAMGYENTPYFDDDAFGDDLLNDEHYYELNSGRIVQYAY